MVRLTWCISQVIPPALLTYFGRTLYLCVTEIGPVYLAGRSRALARIYVITAATLIPAISMLYLRLYFLPSSQSLPPRDPPLEIRTKVTTFECLSPAEAKAVRIANGDGPEGPKGAKGAKGAEGEPMVNRCWRGKCGGGWKPARARHCSECGVCRAGFDHHCALFANCLTAPYIPTFMSLLTLTPPSIVLLSSPLYIALAKRAVKAYTLSWADETIRSWWYDWPFSWVIAGGPVGRYAAGIWLGWKSLDRADGGGCLRVEIGALVGIGLILAMITTALGIATARVIKSGYLTVDRERARSLARAKEAVMTLRKAGKTVPEETMASMTRWQERHYFWVPDTTNTAGGSVVEYKNDNGPYDRGPEGNWGLVMGKGWGWILPWNALRRGMSQADILNWPVNRAVLLSAEEPEAAETT